MLGIVQCLDCANLICSFHAIPKETSNSGKSEITTSNYYVRENEWI